jgi:hypothetical protein
MYVVFWLTVDQLWYSYSCVDHHPGWAGSGSGGGRVLDSARHGQLGITLSLDDHRHSHVFVAMSLLQASPRHYIKDFPGALCRLFELENMVQG